MFARDVLLCIFQHKPIAYCLYKRGCHAHYYDLLLHIETQTVGHLTVLCVVFILLSHNDSWGVCLSCLHVFLEGLELLCIAHIHMLKTDKSHKIT